jgi:hypothetical protein
MLGCAIWRFALADVTLEMLGMQLQQVQESQRRDGAKLDRLLDDMREVKGRLGILESQYASLSNPLDRIDERVERIERRLDLLPAG